MTGVDVSEPEKASNLLFDDAGRDGLLECPVEREQKPGVTGVPSLLGSGVDAFECGLVDVMNDTPYEVRVDGNLMGAYSNPESAARVASWLPAAEVVDASIGCLEHQVDVTEDDDGRAFAECQACCWSVSGSLARVERKADEHEAGR